jgi:hypothetical protein
MFDRSSRSTGPKRNAEGNIAESTVAESHTPSG